MAIKMILLKTGETIITDAKEVVQEEVTRGYLLTQPQIVEAHDKTFLTEESGANSNYEVDVVLKSWMILSKDKEFVITTDMVATICEPLDSVREMYENKINVMTSTAESVEPAPAEVI